MLIQDENITEKQYQIIEELNATLARSSRINKNLLLLAKIENQQFAKNEQLLLSELMEQYLSLFQEHFDQKNIRVHQTIEKEIEVSGSRTLIETLISNLLVNAVRHTDSGGNVSVALSKRSLEFSNSGTFALDKNMLFKRFSRASTDSSGSGLGLAIIHEICLRQNWKIFYDFENNSHHFRITF
jgi:signal transduction histidine kinase